jgi:phage major head subunit gpT-like protein
LSMTQERLDAMLSGIQVLFQTSYGELLKSVNWRKLVMEVESASSLEKYNWLGSVPSMSEWVDERQIRALMAEDYTIVNKNFEATISVDRNDLEDDKLGLLRPRILGLAERAAAFPNKLVFSLLDAGETAKTFDNAAFFNETRKIGESENIKNLLTGSGVASGDAIRTDIAAAVVAMSRFTDDRGEFLELVPDTIVCPPEISIAIRSALTPVHGSQRPEAQYIKDIVDSVWLSDPASWYMVCTTSVLKPVIFQTRKAPEMVAVDRPDSHSVFMRRMVYYGVDVRFGAGLFDPRACVKVANGS